MFNKLFPDIYYDSTYHIDFQSYYDKGYRGIIFDIDNTLVPHDAPADDRSIKLISELKEIGFQVLFLSNNKEPRVKMFNDAVHCTYIYKAHKPSASGYEKAMKKMGTDKDTTMSVGDQIFTDVWGARNAGILSVMVKYMNPKERLQIILKRRLEWIILKCYKSYCKKEGKDFILTK